MPVTHAPVQNLASVNAISRDVHNAWLERQHAPDVAAKKRQPSPYDKPWTEMTAQQRKEASRPTLAVIQALQQRGYKIAYVDEYADPSPGEAGFNDPEVVV